METLKGKAVYKGIALGKISVLRKTENVVKRVKIEDVDAELQRVEVAKAQAIEQLGKLYDKAVKEVGEASAAIFEVHQMMLEDLDFNEAIENTIRTQEVNAEYAVASTGDSFSEMFASMDDDYSTMNSFIQFRKNEDLSFEAFDSELMEMYEAYLKEKGLVKNSTSYYMRIWRSVYNLAVEQGYTTDKKPFKHVYTGIDKTVKRAVPFKIIKMIKELDLSFEPQLELARDIFLFSFYTRGMSFIDMAHLKKSNLQNGILTYSRKKTGQRLTILWEELMQEIVDKYKDDSSEYLLPILRYCDINDRKQYKLRAKQIGRGLNKIGLRLELKAPLTFYVARHSWASIAQDRKVSTDIIREGLGHDNEKTTHIYLASISTSQIDRANQIILKGL